MNQPNEMKGKKAVSAAPQITAASFPALREFLRGYLHQDWQDGYNSPAAAAQQFCADASPEERQHVAHEWQAFRQQTKNLSLPAISALLTGPLGSSWSARSVDDFEAISAVFRQFAPKT
jgi:hypothetical protein